ncbi:protein BTG3 [Bufo gargarizans]|uniref:protein BTG3 n=1 Tax=Bufo gargarizans TaxID=30331 RepID=UPI001CF4D22B|nr:protein BTG3 [Bufo gargarizans]XP_044143494.1 protein BTG3 [Bufo gargarizans]XP_044143495.1 protein BTG3 [Bufo gargarizans]
MKNEISAVVFFLSRLLKNNKKLHKEEIEMFSEELGRILHDKYVDHWYPETPTKGQAYRCIRVNRCQGVDPDLQKACFSSGLLYEDLGLPLEMTLWVDPCEVCCRYGEKNPSFVVASFESKEDKTEISRKVNHAMEKVTSDYHSGSSSDDEVYVNKMIYNPPPDAPYQGVSSGARIQTSTNSSLEQEPEEKAECPLPLPAALCLHLPAGKKQGLRSRAMVAASHAGRAEPLAQRAYVGGRAPVLSLSDQYL